MLIRQLFTAVLVSLVAFGIALMPAGDANAQKPKRGGILTYMIPAKGSTSLDGHKETSYATIHPTAPFYSLLIQVDPSKPGAKELVGDLAKSWTVSSDKKTLVFKIHKGVKFHDGSDMTSRDALASWNIRICPM